jgi:hypothetical protein
VFRAAMGAMLRLAAYTAILDSRPPGKNLTKACRIDISRLGHVLIRQMAGQIHPIVEDSTNLDLTILANSIQ